MLKEVSFVSTEGHKCDIAFCNAPQGEIEDVAKQFWKKHDLPDKGYGSFISSRKKNDDWAIFCACVKINGYALQHVLNWCDAIGQRCSVPSLIQLVREFDVIDKESMAKS